MSTTYKPILSALALVALVVLGYFAYEHRGLWDGGDAIIASSTISGIPVDAAAIASTTPVPEGYLQYTNSKYGFSFYHSPEGKVTEYDEGSDAMTITLENLERVRGFQIFIVPYAEPTISEERFHADVPSGIRNDVENTTLDGVKAVTFTSEDAMLGPTREIWTIKDNYLYEITTFQGVGGWFIPIINSWKWLK